MKAAPHSVWPSRECSCLGSAPMPAVARGCRGARIQGSYTFVSLNSRLESNKEEQERVYCLVLGGVKLRLRGSGVQSAATSLFLALGLTLGSRVINNNKRGFIV